MATWTPISFLQVAERYIGFSIPHDRIFVILSHDDAWVATLNEGIKVVKDENEPFRVGFEDTAKCSVELDGRPVPLLGLYGGTPITESLLGERLILLPLEKNWFGKQTHDRLLEVHDKDGNLIQRIQFRDFSGDWQCATFSDDFGHILIGTPYDLYVFRRT